MTGFFDIATPAEKVIYQLSMKESAINISHQTHYTVRTSEIDQHKKLTAPALFQLMHETAMQHVLQLKLSVWDLETANLAWVLMRQQANIHQMPILGDKLRIFTYPSGFEKLFTYRDYYVYNEHNECLASSTTTWMLMDTASRKPARIPPSIVSILTQQTPNIPHLDRCPGKLPEMPTTKKDSGRMVHWYDLDFNGHLNNVIYARWMLEGLPEAVLNHRAITGFQIHYKAEAHLNDTLICQTETLSENRFLHRLVRGSDQRETAIALSEWS